MQQQEQQSAEVITTLQQQLEHVCFILLYLTYCYVDPDSPDQYRWRHRRSFFTRTAKNLFKSARTPWRFHLIFLSQGLFCFVYYQNRSGYSVKIIKISHTQVTSHWTLQMRSELLSIETVRNTLETERNTLIESLGHTGAGEGSSKEATLIEVGNLMESELQCSICAELFVAATTLNCSHTFCKYCITLWKKKKKECPICRYLFPYITYCFLLLCLRMSLPACR